MLRSINLPFNPKPSTYLHLDLNSCFATIEQQANPHLRGKPVAVAAYTTPSGCILAPSIEAKRLGVKVGMRVKDGKLLCPKLIILASDPWKYRSVHLELKQLLSQYTSTLIPKSIDEFVLNLEGSPSFNRGLCQISQEIKIRIKQEIGDWLTVSIGIAPNRYLAKIAANLHKPDGLDEINHQNYLQIYQQLSLLDLCGIKNRNAARLNSLGIYNVIGFYQSPLWRLRAAFQSITGYYWYLRLRGWEIDDVDFGRKSFGNSYALPQALSQEADLVPIIMKLVQKMSQRLRRHHFFCQGVHLSLLFRDHTHWHQGQQSQTALFATSDIYKAIYRLYHHCPYHNKPVTQIAVSCFNLVNKDQFQLDLFNQTIKKEKITQAMDIVNNYFGDYVLTPALMLNTSQNVPDRVAFGGIKELEEFIITSN